MTKQTTKSWSLYSPIDSNRENSFCIYKNDLKTMVDMLYKATKYMNVEDAMIARRGRPKTRRHPLG